MKTANISARDDYSARGIRHPYSWLEAETTRNFSDSGHFRFAPARQGALAYSLRYCS
jgi:hypothetical protein